MTITFRAVGPSVNHGGTGTRTIATTGIVSGDLVILQVGIANAVAPSALPSGFVLVAGAEITGTNNIRLYSKIAGGSEPATYDVSWAGGGNAAIDWIAVYSSVPQPLQVDDLAVQDNTVSADALWPSVTASAAGAMLLNFGTWPADVATAPPGGSTERWEGGGPCLYLMTETLASGGATGTRTTVGDDVTSRVVSLLLIEQGAVNPTGLNATAVTATQVNLGWNDNWAGEDGWKVERSPAGAGTWSEIADKAADSTSHSDTTASEHTAYDYRVYAYAAAGNTDYSNTASATTIVNAPTNLVATTFDADRIDLTWDDNSGVEDNFKVEQSPNGTTGWVQIATPAANAEAYSVTGLDPNTQYYFKVRCVDGADNSAYSNTANATTDLGAPTGLTAVALSSARIQLSWTAVVGADGVAIERSPNGSTGWTEIDTVDASVHTYQDSGLDEATTYYYRIRSFDE